MSRAALRRIYRQIPQIACKGECHTSCGPIMMQRIEAERIERATGESLKKCETMDCPYLTNDKRCGVYSVRPMICRLWGVTEQMPCQFGCKPERVLTRDEAHSLLSEVAVLGPIEAGTIRLDQLREIAEMLPR